MNNYTNDQRQAIDARDTNLLLAAAAGSGKTSTLVERIARLALEGANVDEMLIVTFTRAAAADMKAKLIDRLGEEADISERAQQQLRRVESASVQTIDAFCSDVLRSHFEAAGVDPAFRIPDAAELRQLASAALDEALEAQYAEGGDDLDALGFGRGVKGVRAFVLELHAFAGNRPNPEDWLRRAALELPSGDGALWFDELLSAARRELWDLHAMARYALSLSEHPLGPAPYASALRADIQTIERALNADYDGLIRVLDAYAPEKLGSVRRKDIGSEELELKEQAQKLRGDVKDGIKRLCVSMMRADDALEDVRLNQGPMRALLQLTLAFSKQLDELKAERSVLSFSDVAHKALGALQQEGVARAVRARFTHIFVDEYQDVSDVQQALIDCIRRPDNVFMVGDVKQSIYRFRQAEPSLFLDKYQSYAAGNGGRLIALQQNFRSRKSILDFTNAVFERVMVGGDSEIEYDELARLRPGANLPGEDPPIELTVLTGADEPEDGEEPLPGGHTQAELEGMWIANRIRRLLDQERYVDAKTPEGRPYQPRDICVLVRYRSGMRDIERMLAEAGIPVYADVTGGYLDALEVQTLVALLQVIENRRRDNELLAVLHSPVCGLSSEQLAEIRLGHPEGSYRDAMLAYMRREDEISESLHALERKLDRWRVLSKALPLSHLVDTVLRESGYYAHVGRMPMGALGQANLDLFLSYASDFDAAQTGALTGFLRYIRQIKLTQDDMGAAHELGAGDNVVQLITAHKSKGLEYPVVIAAQLGRKLARNAQKGELCAHRDLGMGFALTDRALGSRRETLPQRAIWARTQLEQLNEEMRILYVMLTRAKDRLILVGSVKKFESEAPAWRIAAQSGMTPATFLDVLMPLVLSRPDGDKLISGEAAMVQMEGARVHAARLASDKVRLPVPAAERIDDRGAPDAELLCEARRALDWRYPYEAQVLLPLKLTVSGLTRELTGPAARPNVTRRPKFLSGDGLSATERGTLTHAALMHLALAPLRGLGGGALEREVKRQLNDMLARGKLFETLDARLVLDFLTSAIGQRLLNSERVEREWAFNLRMPMTQALGLETEESVLVQGVIDCCFIEDGQWVLLDYKTDRADDLDALAQHYRPQLLLYARALSRITGIGVKQKLLCLLRYGQAIDLA